MNGVWYDPRFEGCGFVVNAVNGGASAAVMFYGHRPGGGQLWFIASGTPGTEMKLLLPAGTGLPTTHIDYVTAGTVQMIPSPVEGELSFALKVRHDLLYPVDFSPRPPEGHMVEVSFTCQRL